MISIINYGLGNIQAFANIYKNLNIPYTLASTENEILNASKLVLPGVGHFDHAMQLFNASGLRKSIEQKVLNEKTPIIGICVGMQMLAKSSEEGIAEGLGWIDGKVKKLSIANLNHESKLPHMGWNTTLHNEVHPLLRDIPNDSRFYFLHSFYFECAQPESVLTQTIYGEKFASAVLNKHIFGVQFHPEKSHQNGINLLKNFAQL